MRINEVELSILVNGRPIIEYSHDNKIFIEGRAGSEYEIEVRNHTWHRLETVLSVDGLSVIDGKLAGPHSTGYLIEPRAAIRIPGWIVNSATIAKFAFAGKQSSYATQMTGDARNNGVIGAMAFREKIVPQLWNTMLCSSSASGSLRSSTLSAEAEVKTSGGLVGGRGIAPQSNYVAQSLGTAFGESAQFSTRTVEFKRGELQATLVCHYDEKRGLKERGIRFERRHPKHNDPQPFPATGCVPPPGWQG